MEMSKTTSFSLSLFAIFFLSTQTLKVKPDIGLIENTCKQTINYNLCTTILKSDPRSETAKDVDGLALIMVDIVETKSKAMIDTINNLLGKSPELKDPLSICASDYNAVLVGDVSMAVEGLEKGDPKYAEQGMADAVVEIDSCENAFKGKSPLTSGNKDVHDVADVTRSVIRQLL
jgi:pectinesterase inhibitor-like protein